MIYIISIPSGKQEKSLEKKEKWNWKSFNEKRLFTGKRIKHSANTQHKKIKQSFLHGRKAKRSLEKLISVKFIFFC